MLIVQTASHCDDDDVSVLNAGRSNRCSTYAHHSTCNLYPVVYQITGDTQWLADYSA